MVSNCKNYLRCRPYIEVLNDWEISIPATPLRAAVKMYMLRLLYGRFRVCRKKDPFERSK